MNKMMRLRRFQFRYQTIAQW